MRFIALSACFALATLAWGCGNGDANSGLAGKFSNNSPDLANTQEMSWLMGGVWTSSDASRTISISNTPKQLTLEWHQSQVDDQNDSTLPHPTVCSYRFVASEFSIKKGSWWDSNTTHTIVAQVSRVDLLEDSISSEGCNAYLTIENAKKARSPFYFGFYRNADGTLFQNGGTFSKR